MLFFIRDIGVNKFKPIGLVRESCNRDIQDIAVDCNWVRLNLC